MNINKILKISIMILFAFVFTDIALSSGCNPPVITSPNDNEVYLTGGTFPDLCKASGDVVITWSGGGEFDPTAGSPTDYTAPGTKGIVTITATNSSGSDQVEIKIADVIYVDEDVVGGLDDGTSWANAFDTLQEGLNIANSDNDIWVAEGTYKPGASQIDTFHLVPGVEMYGGFDPANDDDLWDERDYINNVTILSGDIDGDGLDSSNTYFVVTANDVTIDGSTRLDGFTITMGWSYHNLCDGAGMKIEDCDPNVANCIFKENRAPGSDGDGGGMGCYNSSPEVTNCIFIDNIAGDDGGALVNTYGSNGTFTNCVFYSNNTNGENVKNGQGKSNGGAIWNTASEKTVPIGSSPTFINCLIAGNSTVPGSNNGGKNGGGAANKGSGTNPVYINCTFTGNTANWDGGGMVTKDDAEATVINCIFWDNSTGVSYYDDAICDKDGGVTNVSYSDLDQSGYAGNNNNISQDPKFFDTDDIDGPDNLFMTLDDGAEIGSDSPCIDKGNNTPVTESYDIIGRTRIIDGDETSPTTVDMGAYEFQPATVKEPYLLFLGTNTEMMARWELNQDRTCTIEWGTDTSYGLSWQVDEDVAYPGQYLYRHTITGLTVGTKYYYRVRGVGSGTFYSAPASDATAVKFLAYGDTRGENNVTPVGHDQVCYRMVQTYKGDSDFQTFTLHVAEYVQTGQDEFDWQNEFFLRSKDNVMEFLANMPLVGCMGNHEHDSMTFCDSIYAKYFPFPGATSSTDDWYEIKYGPVHVVVINEYRREALGSGGGLTLNGTALAQVKSALENSDREWTFLMFHAPAYSARGGHQNNPHPIDQLEAWINDYVDIVFAGHNHYYARCEMDGVQHITTGGGGAPLRTPQSNPGLQESDSSYHHCEITIDGTDIQLVARRANNSVIETVSWSH